MARILVGIATKSTVDAQAAVAAANLDHGEHDVDFTYAKGRGVYGAAQVRNDLAKQALAEDYDYLFSIDSDTIVPRDALLLLMEGEPDVALGVYRYKNEQTGDAPFFKEDDSKLVFADIPAERFPIKAGGLGCSLISTAVLRKLPVPIFHWDERPTGCHTSEDIWFCRAARAAGYTLYVDGRVKCGHAGRKVYE